MYVYLALIAAFVLAAWLLGVLLRKCMDKRDEFVKQPKGWPLGTGSAFLLEIASLALVLLALLLLDGLETLVPDDANLLWVTPLASRILLAAQVFLFLFVIAYAVQIKGDDPWRRRLTGLTIAVYVVLYAAATLLVFTHPAEGTTLSAIAGSMLLLSTCQKACDIVWFWLLLKNGTE